MRKIFISLLTATSLVPTIGYVTACSWFSPEPAPAPNKDFTFNEIKGATGKINTIISNKTNDVFYATNGTQIFIKTEQDTQFIEIEKTGIDDELTKITSIAVNDNDDFFVSINQDYDDEGNVYKYDKTKKEFTQWYVNKKTTITIDAILTVSNTFYTLEKTDENNPNYTVFSLDSTLNEIKEADKTKIGNINSTQFKKDFCMTSNKTSFFILSAHGATDVTLLDTNANKLVKKNFSEMGTPITLTTYDNEVFVIVEKNNKYQLYRSKDNEDYTEVNLTINFKINSITTDNTGRFYFGGQNKNLYSATISNDFKDFSVLDDQEFSNVIFSINYYNEMLLIGSNDSIFIGKRK